MPAANSKSCDGLQVTARIGSRVSQFARGEKSYITYGTLRINSMCHCRAQTIIKVALAIVVPFFGTVFLTTLRKAKCLRLFKRLPKIDVYLIMFYYIRNQAENLLGSFKLKSNFNDGQF